MNTRESLTVS